MVKERLNYVPIGPPVALLLLKLLILGYRSQQICLYSPEDTSNQQIFVQHKILGVQKGADKEEIKSAYFKLAKKYHPDISSETEAKKKFAQIKEAYECLNDDSQRGSYDFNKQSQEFRQSYSQKKSQDDFYKNFNFKEWRAKHGSNYKPKDNFSEFYEDFDDFINFRKSKASEQNNRSQSQNRVIKGKNVVMHISLSFLEAINGAKKEVTYHKDTICTPCNGSGKEKVKNYCYNCGGQGYVRVRRNNGRFGQVPCPKCSHYNKNASRCSHCRGKGTQYVKVTDLIRIPKGVNTGVNLKLTKRGNVSKNGPAGDLILKIDVDDHDYFNRKGFNIHTKQKVTVAEALLGASFEIETIRGPLKITMSPGIQSGEVKKIVQYGINKLPPLQKQRGHHFVKFELEVPKQLTEEQRDLFMEFSKVEKKINQVY
ncbi:unnamed protein product [Moneuplotes crassus]|uniref:Chaperone protein DnaJ n=1 Tax=Euplotes crassus TaxID=5936 RepID=A0AAD1UEY5_EUPCR|nr:unnamed protein product [Moneuplotes crassus]